MPTFDETKLPYALEPILVQGANHAVHSLRAHKVLEIVLAEPPDGFRLSNKGLPTAFAYRLVGA